MDLISRYWDNLRKRPVTDYPPHQVVEVKPEEYIHHTPFHREDSLIVYGLQTTNAASPAVSFSKSTSSVTTVTSPTTSIPVVDLEGNPDAHPTAGSISNAIASTSGSSPSLASAIMSSSSSLNNMNNPVYEVIFHRDTPNKSSQTAYSLVRTTDLSTAEFFFRTYMDVIPTLASCCPSIVSVDTLQDVCNYLTEHPKQSLAHVAAHFGFNDCFKNESVQFEVQNMVDPETQLTPLHLAVKSGRSATIQFILSLDPRNLTSSDKFGNNILHFAAPTSKETISLLSSAILSSSSSTTSEVPSLPPGTRSAFLPTAPPTEATQSDPPSRDDTLLLRMINQRNTENITPLHLACSADKPECVKELLKNGADVNGACIDSSSSTRLESRPNKRVNRNSLSSKPSSSQATNTSANDAASSVSSDSSSSPESNNPTGFDKLMIEHLNPKDMKHGGNPLHWAKSPSCMEPLIEMGCDINAKNFSGETVLHVMVSRRQLSCIVTLLSYGADVNEKGPNGVTPLHLAVRTGDFTVVQALIVFGAKLNEENSAGESARHLAATTKRTPAQDMILFVLNSVGAKRCTRSKTSCTEGCRPMGTFNGSPPESAPFSRIHSLYDPLLGRNIVKAAVSRKKKSLFSGQTETAGDRATSPKRSSFSSIRDKKEDDECMIIDNDSQSRSSKPSTQGMNMDCDEPEERKQLRVLSLDGGGIKGLVLIQMLAFLEDFIGGPVHSYFDWIAGTSTGGILAMTLASGYTASQCRQFYFKMKNKVFVGTRPYESEPLDAFLKKLFGETSTMADITKPKIMLTATVGDKFPAELHLLRNYESPNDILGHSNSQANTTLPCSPKPEDTLMWTAARSSGAAPTYFRPCGRYLDGGLVSNNPTLDLLTEITYINAALDATGQSGDKVTPAVVVSLGTGAPPVIDVPVIDVFRPDTLVGVAKIAFMASSLGQLLVDQASQSDGQVVERARAWCHTVNLPFFRCNPPLSENISMDETSNIKLINMLWETQAYMMSRKEELNELRILLQ